MRTLTMIWKYMEGKHLKYVLSVLFVGLASVFMLINPLIIRVTIDSIIGDDPLNLPAFLLRVINRFGGKEFLLNSLWLPAGLIVLLTLLRGIFLFLKGKWSAEGAEHFARNLREELFEHLQYLDFSYHIKKDTGDLIQRCTSDLETIRKFMAVQLVEVGRAFFMLTSVLLIMLRLDKFMTLISLISVPMIFTFAYIFFKNVRKAFKDSDEAEARLSTVIQENLTGVRVVKAFARQPHEYERFKEKNREHKELTFRLIKLLAYYWSLSDIICFLQIGLVLIVGAVRATSGQITLGTLVVFTTYIGMLLWPVRQTGRILTDLGKAVVAVERINEILAEPKEDFRGYGYKSEIKGNIEIKNISFAYLGEEKVIDNMSFKVRAGEKLGILGPTGSGKSTLTYLLTRLLDYQEGSIKIEGKELKEYDRSWIRENIGLVLQEPFLFARDIKNNIGIAVNDVTESEIERAASVAAFDHVVNDFDKGYATEVGERGVSLSGGQKQRLAIARTLIRDCPVLIFDDSLSAVDTNTDAMIRSALKERYGEKTMIIISHRINTLADSDRILVIDKGQVVQRGRHEDLICEPGLYRNTWQMQQSKVEVI
ncbi:MAG: ABC transporter ATP-binding protein [Bacillota bacterium]